MEAQTERPSTQRRSVAVANTDTKKRERQAEEEGAKAKRPRRWQQAGTARGTRIQARGMAGWGRRQSDITGLVGTGWEQRRHLFLHSFITHGQKAGTYGSDESGRTRRSFIVFLQYSQWRRACSWQREEEREEHRHSAAVAIHTPWPGSERSCMQERTKEKGEMLAHLARDARLQPKDPQPQL